ncbi:hypothetical protein LSAT2_023563 [Lamellibrachia satsuma]|nr:hypothetical protein LSAT2_023563 [Lamellibrachia satsuma]
MRPHLCGQTLFLENSRRRARVGVFADPTELSNRLYRLAAATANRRSPCETVYEAGTDSTKRPTSIADSGDDSLSELESDENAQAGMNNIINLSVCEIRWSSRATALCTFKSAFTAVVTALGYLEEDGDDKSRR